MRKENILILLAFSLVGFRLSAAEFEIIADLNEDQKSYSLRIANLSQEPLICDELRVKLSLSGAGCKDGTRIEGTVLGKKIEIKPGERVLDPLFGAELRTQLESERKVRNLIFCGDPEIEQSCRHRSERRG